MLEKVTVIEKYSYQEDLEDAQGMDSKQVDSKKEHSVTLKSSPEKDKFVERPKVCSTERDMSLEVPVEEADKEEEDDDLIFRKMNIPWLLDKTSTSKEGLCIYLEYSKAVQVSNQFSKRNK